ncbi:isocitrate lyase/phosphoenolpyruvate mutase family protein [Salmonella enterica]|nr:isocitrate lyase/phosphoenolpyruvate mutase family protein [Salmonella enterica]EIK5436077.1 isocitrate lyase/phosphoenolpyruvate mutase family protein [Salmonella enterica]EIR0753572.1 isocitrate lyase/phosphoenolpyruvate mutase family protein [Salmonella enterica]EKT7008484.1 isocitrate lyase/phosphoenolpyruvate mutase family protein [Salmonella enterica]
MNFAELHNQHEPLLIANVWDAASAVAAQEAGYQALGTSSAAIAATLGYEDGQGIPFEELFYMVTRIRAVSNLPLSVDMEAGYGDSAEEIITHLMHLAETGVSGVNLEDSRIIKGVRQLDDVSEFSRNLRAVCDALRSENYRLFLNIRTDTYLLGHKGALQETILRGQSYKAAGADGLFVPCLTSEKDISLIAEATGLPLNVMCMHDLPTFGKLKLAGVSRISMGNFVHSAIQSKLTDLIRAIRSRQTFEGLFGDENNR